MEKYKEVKVIWVDTMSYNGEWINIAYKLDVFKPELCYTKGYLIKKTKYVIAIAQSVSGSGVYNVMVIPRGCVKKIEEDGSSKN